MRIISGDFKGKKIFIPLDKKTRPIRDLVKESIFNLIAHSSKFKCSIEKSNVLDLFSGSGNISYEFASRGVKEIYSVDINFNCIKFLYQWNR